MIGKLCIMKIDGEQVSGQALTDRTSEYIKVPLGRFPEAPKVGDVFSIDYSFNSARAVIERLDETFHEIHVKVSHVFELKHPIVAGSYEEALSEFQTRVKRRPDLYLTNLSSEIIKTEVNVEDLSS